MAANIEIEIIHEPVRDIEVLLEYTGGIVQFEFAPTPVNEVEVDFSNIGPQGPQGIQGPAGPQGLQGDPGADGAQGPAGPQGLQGDPGADGAQGPQGVQGPAGPQGLQGDPGADGAQGPQGIQGPAGPQGLQGDPGADGAQGPQGIQGPAGPQGLQGDPGADGAQGAQGIQGPAGPQGLQGDPGADGAQGPQGVQGPAGPQGLQGDPGADGVSYMVLPFHSDGSANITMTNQAVAEQFLANSNRNITKADLTNFLQVRMLVRVVTGSASVNSPRVRLRYRNGAFSTTITDYSDIGASEVSASLAATGLIDSGWINLAAGAKADVYITVTQIGGDAAADPAVGMVILHFK